MKSLPQALLMYILGVLVLMPHLFLLPPVCINLCHAFQASTFPSSKSSWSTNDNNKEDKRKSSVVNPKNKNKNNQKLPQKEHDDEWIAIAQERLAGFFPFALDDWQLYAGGAICNGYNVVVSAPTGAG